MSPAKKPPTTFSAAEQPSKVAGPRKKPRRQATGYEAVQRAAHGRAARRENCRSCGADVLRGLDGKVTALEVVVDPVPVDAVAEVLAWAGGRRSYFALRSGPRVDLDRRYRDQVVHDPGTRPGGWPVYLAHVCHDVPAGPTQSELDLEELTSWQTDGPPPF